MNDILTKEVDRKEFLKMAGVGVGVGIAMAGIGGLLQGCVPPTQTTQTKKKKQYAMVIDLRRCIGCHSCQVACKAENDVPLGVFRSWVKEIDKGRYPTVKRFFLPRLCNHCSDAPCVAICPVKASYKREDGVVLIRQERCIGCKMCIGACPYNSRFINFTRIKGGGVADKCDFCVHRIDNGLVPACVATCIGRARIFGDLNDPESEIAKVVSTQPVQTLQRFLNTNPKVYYIGLEEDIIGPTKGHQKNYI